jgi:serine phosphatase RsbU (regulator of sigma subunit)
MFKTTLLRALAFAVLPAVLLSCSEEKHVSSASGSNRSDSLIFAAGLSKNYKRMLMLVDSFEQQGSISALDANRWRGTAYYRQNQYRPAEMYYKRAMECEIKTDQDLLGYIKSARRLSELLLVKGNFEGSIEVAMSTVAMMREKGIGSDIDFAILLNNIGCCQINLGRDAEAHESFITARQHYINRWSTDSSGRGFQEAVIGTVYTSQAYINTHRYAESIYWIDRTEMLLNKYRKKPDARLEYFDEYQGRIEIMRAVAKLGLEKPDSAALAYQAFLRTKYSTTSTGRINANDYLLAAHRYTEAADNYRYLDQMLEEHDMELSLDNIQLYLLPKMRANIGAQRRDSVMALGLMLCDAVDTAIVKSKDDETAVLATIYDTQQKEAQIALQQADMAHQRITTLIVALGLVITFFSVFVFFRHRAAKRLSHAHERLEEAHTKLQKAYDQLEETTAQKERIESELRIARDIQKSMVPGVFPDDRDDLDIYAAMTPAKEVGGDLYGYLILGDKLYFCIGDVSGKGVPASLFMAQATRLFRTLATQGMMPAEICTRMNAALTEDNEQGMFVTMFIGLVDLKTGHLEFCNAGHNPPIVNNEFMQMEPNAPIGLWPGLEFVGEHIDSILGMPMLIYTDGLTEAENRQQEQFGDERLLNILCNTHFDNARHVVEHLVNEVEKHRDGAEPNDDLTVMCLKVG